MKKRLVIAVLILIALPIAFADIFDWSLFVQGGDFNKAGSLGQYQRGNSAISESLPADAYMYYFSYSGGRRDSCGGDMGAVIDPSVLQDGRGLPGSLTQDIPYQHSSQVTVRLHGSDNKVSGISGSLGGKSCHVGLSYQYKYGVKFFGDTYFVNRRHNPLELGKLSPRIPAGKVLQAGQSYKVFSHNPGVMMWFGTPESINKTTTTNENDLIFACADLDQNGQCDYKDEQTCVADGGAWYAGRCCGVDADTPTCQVYTDFVRTDFAGNIIANITFSKPAICGLDIDGNPEWAYIQDIGNIHELTQCPELNIVSDGTDYYHCGLDTSTTQFAQLQPQSFDFLDITFGSKTHQFTCVNNKITECTGDDIPMSAINIANLGEVIPTSQGDRYCSDDGTTTTDLDSQPIACSNAVDISGTGTEKWTGHYCCSEDLDTNDDGETYNDPFDPGAFYNVANSSAGGCFDREWIQSGSWLVEDKIINAQGVFWGCDASNLPESNVDDLHVGGQVVQSMSTCDKLDLGAPGRPEGRYAVCQPWGEITFSDNELATIQTQISWNATGGVQPQGCCPSDQCWNGAECQAKGTYHRVGASGFSCN